ncbi:unnamed protein product [Closterium sp. Yama58-4]|nr:unnamed protein product [Closterium sp. Yama58-4]
MDFYRATIDSQQLPARSGVLLSPAASEPSSFPGYRSEDPGPPFKTRRIRPEAIVAPATDTPMAATSLASPQEPAMAVRINRPDLQSLTDVVNADGHAWLKYGEKRISKNTVMRQTHNAAPGENRSPVSQQFASNQAVAPTLWSPMSIDDSPIGPLDAARNAAMMSLPSSPATSPLASPLSVDAPRDACERACDRASERASDRASTGADTVIGLGESALRGHVGEESRHVTDMAIIGATATSIHSADTGAGVASRGVGAAACFPVLAATHAASHITACDTASTAAVAHPWGGNRAAVSAPVSQLQATQMSGLVRADALAWGSHGGGEQGGLQEHARGAAPAAAMAVGPARARISACTQGAFFTSQRCSKQAQQGGEDEGDEELLSLDLSLRAPGACQGRETAERAACGRERAVTVPVDKRHALNCAASMRKNPQASVQTHISCNQHPFLFSTPKAAAMASRHGGATRSDQRQPRVDPEECMRAWRSFIAGLGAPRSLGPHESQISGSFRPFLRPFALGALIGSLLVAVSLLSANPPRADPSAAAASASGAGGAETLGGAGAGGDAASGASYTGRREGELFSRGGVTSDVVTSNVVTISSSGGALDAVDSLPGLSEGFGLALTDLEQRYGVGAEVREHAPMLSNRQLAALMADVAQWRARSGASMDGVLRAAREELRTLLASPLSTIQLVSPSSLPLLLSFLRPPNASNHPTASALSAALATLLPIEPASASSLTAAAAAAPAAAREEYEELVRERGAWEVVGLRREWVEARREWMGPARNTMEALQRLMSMQPGSGIFRKLFEYIFWLRPYVALFRSIPTPTLSSLSSLRLSSIRSSLSLDGRQAASCLNTARSALLSSLHTLSSRCGVDAGGEFWTDMHDAALQRYRWVAESAFDKWCVDWAAVGGRYRQHAGMVVPGEEWRREGLHGGGMEKDIEKGTAANRTGNSSTGSSAPPPPVTYTGWVQGTPLAIRRSALLSLGSLAPLLRGEVGGADEGQGDASSSSSSRIGAWVVCVRAWLAGYRVGLVHAPSAGFLLAKQGDSGAGSNGAGSVGGGSIGAGMGPAAVNGELSALVAPYLHAVKQRIALLNS